MPEIEKDELLDIMRKMPGYISAYLIDGDQLKVLYYSPRIIKTLGFSADEYEKLVQRDACDSIFAGDRAKILAHFKRCMQTSSDVYSEFTIQRKRGDYVKTLVVSRIVGTMDGKPVLVSSFSNVALESEPHALPAISASDYKSMVDNIPCGIAILRMRDGDISLLAANRALCAMVGVSQKGMNGDSADELFRRVHPDDVDASRNAISVMFSKHHGAVCIYRTLNEKTHKYLWLHASGRSIDQPDGSQIAYICYTDVTVQKETEADLRRSRQRYQLAVKGADLTVWEFDIKTRRATCHDDGFARAGFPNVIEDMPYSLLDHVDEKDRAQFLLMYADIEGGKKSVSGEFWYRRSPSDKPRCARATYSTVFDNRGRPVKAYGVMQDITLQKLEAEKYDGMMQKMLRASSRSLSTVCLDLTLNRVEKDISSGADVAYKTADEFLAAGAKRVVEQKAAEACAAAYNRRALLTAYFSGQTERSDLYLRRGDDGKNGWAELLVSMAQNPETGNVEAVVSVFDRNEKVKKERLIQRLTNEEYDFIAMAEVENRVLRVMNIKAGEYCALQAGKSYTEADIIYDTLASSIAAEDQDRYVQCVRLSNVLEHLKAEGGYSFSFTHVSPTGERRRKQLRYFWLDDSHGEILVVRADVTAAYQRDREHLRLLQSALRSAEKASQMRNDCITNLSHDIRTPLNGIAGFTHLALQSTSQEERTDYLRKIEASASRLSKIVSDMLDFSRIESGETEFQPKYFDARTLLDDVASDVKEAADKRSIWVDIDSRDFHLKRIYADRTSLRKVLATLLLNAISFSDTGGKIELKLESFEPVGDGANCRITVRDHGSGIAASFLPYLFEPFAQEMSAEKTEIAGVSLSLAVVKRLVEMMGGAVWAESEKGKGTAFTLLFRFMEPVQTPSAPSGTSLEPNCLHGKKILVCEDNPLNLEITQTMLEQRGALVTCADNGETGVEAFAASQEDEYDAVLMDIRMPRMDGLTAAHVIRSLDRSDAQTIPIIAMTADILDKHMDGLKSAGVDAWLEKPFAPDDLFQMLSQRLRK